MELWHEIPHSELPGSVADVWAEERATLMQLPPAFEGYVEHSKRVSPTCLISFERNRYSVPASFAYLAGASAPWLSLSIVACLLLFGFVFAVNSAVHFYLILAFTSAERVTRNVGFYYMSNAAGRLLGTLLSGVSYQVGGLPLCLATAGLMVAASWVAVRRLKLTRH